MDARQRNDKCENPNSKLNYLKVLRFNNYLRSNSHKASFEPKKNYSNANKGNIHNFSIFTNGTTVYFRLRKCTHRILLGFNKGLKLSNSK